MINLVNSNSMTQQQIWNRRAVETGTVIASTSSDKQQDQSTENSKDLFELSMEDHMGMMMFSQNQSITTTSEDQTETDSNQQNTEEPMGPPPEKPMGPPPQNQPVNYDTDGDGSISADEYEAAVEDMGIEDAESAEDFFANYDTNSDGEISEDEVSAMNSSSITNTSEDITSQSTESIYDTDGDGSISTDEYEAAVEKMGKTDAASSEDFFNEYDSNADGEISMEEILAGLNSNENQASKVVNAYELNYQYMYDENKAGTNTNSIV